MLIISMAVVVVAVTLVVIAAFTIPALMEIRKTAVEYRALAGRVEGELMPLLQELRNAVIDIKLLTHSANEKAAQAQTFFDTLGDAGKNLKKINTVVGAVAGGVSTSSLWVTGAKAAAKSLIDRFSKKRRISHGG